MDIDKAAQERLEHLQDGYMATQLVYVAAKLGVADALAGGPRTGEALAEELGADPDSLRRVLRALAAYEVFEELPDGRFGLAPVGALLRTGTPTSLRGPVITRGEIYLPALGRLLDAVRSGESAFRLTYGASFFEHLAGEPAKQAAFQKSMTDRSVHEAKAVVAAYDFGRFRRLVDVGGGQGVLLSAILAATPGLTGVLFDLPKVVENAHIPPYCETVGGDFFVEVPSGADAYLISRVIHNWDDDEAVRILSTCRKAMPDDATLLVVDIVQPERATDLPAAIRMDINMLALFTGRERTESEFATLLATAGLTLESVIPTTSHVGVQILQARPN